MTTKTHPADARGLDLIPACKTFTASILKDGSHFTTEHPSLGAARIEAIKLNATVNNGRRALVYAITAEGRAILVPADYGREEPAKAKAPRAGKPATAKAEK